MRKRSTATITSKTKGSGMANAMEKYINSSEAPFKDEISVGLEWGRPQRRGFSKFGKPSSITVEPKPCEPNPESHFAKVELRIQGGHAVSVRLPSGFEAAAKNWAGWFFGNLLHEGKIPRLPVVEISEVNLKICNYVLRYERIERGSFIFYFAPPGVGGARLLRITFEVPLTPSEADRLEKYFTNCLNMPYGSRVVTYPMWQTYLAVLESGKKAQKTAVEMLAERGHDPDILDLMARRIAKRQIGPKFFNTGEFDSVTAEDIWEMVADIYLASLCKIEQIKSPIEYLEKHGYSHAEFDSPILWKALAEAEVLTSLRGVTQVSFKGFFFAMQDLGYFRPEETWESVKETIGSRRREMIEFYKEKKRTYEKRVRLDQEIGRANAEISQLATRIGDAELKLAQLNEKRDSLESKRLSLAEQRAKLEEIQNVFDDTVKELISAV